MSNWVIRSQYNMATDGRDVLIARRRYDGSLEFVQPFTLLVRPAGSLAEPTISTAWSETAGGEDFLQACLNHAWEVGLRPTGFNDTTQQVRALKDHLNDMRKLAIEGSEPIK